MIFFLVCFGITVALLFFSCTLKPKNYPPGPSRLPLIGNLLDYKQQHDAVRYHHLVWTELSKAYGPVIGLKLGRHLVVGVCGAEAVREVMTREEFEGRPDGFFFRLRTFGQKFGVVFTDGPLWRKHRKFCTQHLRNLGYGRCEMEEKIYRESRELVDLLKERGSESMFMQDVFNVPVTNVLWTMIAGQRFNLKDEKLGELLRLVKDCFRLVDMSGGLINQLPFLRYIMPNGCGYTAIMHNLKEMWRFLEETIKEHKESKDETQLKNFIDVFLHSMQLKVDPTFTENQLMAVCLDLFMAGSETTSNSLGFSVLYMILYPEVQKKVQEELDRVVGRDRWPTLKDKDELKYTKAVLFEIQRITSVGPMGVAHRAIESTTLFGYNIPKDTIVLTNIYSVHTEESFWKDPLAFKPERFLDKDGNVVVDEGHFMPFGVGKRRCLGEILAKSSMFIFFTTFLHNFTLEADKEFYPVAEGFDGVTLSPKPFKARLVFRKGPVK